MGTGVRGRRQAISCSSFPFTRLFAFVHHLLYETGVVVGGVEITAAAQDEGLVHGVFEAVVSLLGDAVFVAFTAIDAGGAQP